MLHTNLRIALFASNSHFVYIWMCICVCFTLSDSLKSSRNFAPHRAWHLRLFVSHSTDKDAVPKFIFSHCSLLNVVVSSTLLNFATQGEKDGGERENAECIILWIMSITSTLARYVLKCNYSRALHYESIDLAERS